jgi:single-strand DNA-binding protein
MAGSVNKAFLIGRAGRDPSVKDVGGRKIASFSIATDESWKDRATGERKQEVTWHNVVVFNERTAEVVERYVKKGSHVLVEGTIKNRKYTGRDGVERVVTEIVIPAFGGQLVLLDRQGNRPPERTEERMPTERQPAGDLDDEIQF